MLQWNVFLEDWNARTIKSFDIFQHGEFRKGVQKLLKKHSDKAAFAEDLKKEVMYYFWAKCEYEVVITSWPPYISAEELDRLNKENEEHKGKYGHPLVRNCIRPECAEKIDVYRQAMLNWDVFVDYVWAQKRKTKTQENKGE